MTLNSGHAPFKLFLHMTVIADRSAKVSTHWWKFRCPHLKPLKVNDAANEAVVEQKPFTLECAVFMLLAY